MRKIKIISILLACILFSCQDQLKENYSNPEVVDPSQIPGEVMSSMFAGIIYQWSYFIKDYGELWWQNSGWGLSQYSQINDRYITPRYSAYEDYDDLVGGNGFDDSSVRDYFNNYYTKMKDWVLMKKLMSTFTEQQQKDNQIFLDLAIAMKDWGGIRNVDFFNKIPYSEAFKGLDMVFFPKYDEPKDIYESILIEWGEIANRLNQDKEQMSPEAISNFTRQDYALKGDFNKWAQWINAMRLRYAVRLSGVDPEFAKPVIADALKNLPEEDLYFSYDYSEKQNLPKGGYTWQRAFYETVYVFFVPNTIMGRMNFGNKTYEEGIDDPRLPVIAMPTKHNDYRGVSMNADANDLIYKGGEKYYPYCDDLKSSFEQNAFSMYNHATYAWNVDCPAIMFTRAEVDLLKAEIALKGLASTGKTADEHVKDAVMHSTDFWYYINSLSNYGQPTYPVMKPTKPAASVISQYADMVKSKYTAAPGLEDKMEIIMQQKYIHLNVFEPYELFAELRRTRHPKLEPFTFNGKVMKPCPERLRYPTSEMTTNTENFLKVKGEDNFTTPIFWVPENKRGESYYRNDYNY